MGRRVLAARGFVSRLWAVDERENIRRMMKSTAERVDNMMYTSGWRSQVGNYCK